MKIYPFSALVDQDALKTALLLAAVDPGVGGVLIQGQKGTAKSTAARALATLIPPIEVVADCPYHSHPDEPEQMQADALRRYKAGEELPRSVIPVPLVEVPLGATEDRVVGSLDIHSALEHGEVRFQPGLLAQANRGVLYVDEVNLLPDHLVDVLLDSAASGVNRVEREGVSHSHPARFLLVGTMNPEEGELRPQFLDRFGLCVTVTGVRDPASREQLVRRRLAFEDSPERFVEAWREHEEALARRIAAAREALAAVELTDRIWRSIVQLVSAAEVHGHRAELAIARGARALAALTEKQRVTQAEVAEAARLVLPHRLRNMPLQLGGDIEEQVDQVIRGSLDSDGPEYYLTETTEGAAAPSGTEHGESDRGQTGNGKQSSGSGLEMQEEDMQVPGAAAAGSLLFTHLKKKLPKAPQIPATSLR